MKRWIMRATLGLIAGATLLYLGDFAVLQVRIKHGTGFETVTVEHLLATPLKGKKVEYDALGPVMERCSRSALPQEGSPPCWWLKRHTTVWD